jgi:TRAP-type mannitol/chloroaromatic compound transport system substrate-binding protein
MRSTRAQGHRVACLRGGSFFALREMERLNTEALAALTSQHNVKLRSFPKDLVAAARKEAKDVLAELAARWRARPPGA